MANNFPNLRPSFSADFVNGVYVDPRITFSRAGTRTYFGQEMVKAEENLLIRSQAFNTSPWSGVNTVAVENTADTTAPNGTSTASKLTAVAGLANHFRTQIVTSIDGATYTNSLYAKKGTNDFVQIYISNQSGSFANFDLDAGVVGTTGGITSAAIIDEGGGWYRCVVIWVASGTNRYATIKIAQTSSDTYALSWTAAGTEAIYIWQAQMEQRASVTAPTVTTTQPITRYQRQLKTAAANEWPREFDPVTGECLGRSVWESRTNLFLRSEEFDNSGYWQTGSNVTVEANQLIAPDGTLSADLLREAATTNTHRLSANNNAGFAGIANQVNTLTVYAKKGTRTWLRLAMVNPASTKTATVWFNLDSGVIGTATYVGTASNAASIQSIGNGWYRCSLTTNVQESGDNRLFPFVSISDADNSASYAGAISSFIYIWGAQLEAGAFATPYIPTVASQVTRLADSAVMTGANFSSWFNPEQGTLFVDATNVGQNIPSVSINDGTANNRMNLVSRVDGTSTGDEYAVVVTGGAGQAAISGQAYITDSKSSISYKFNEIRATMNGNTPGLDSTAVLPIVNRLAIGAIATQGCIYIKRLTYYPQALTAANLQAITR